MKKSSSLLFPALLFVLALLACMTPVRGARAEELTLQVSWTELQCSAPVTFTLTASGGSGNYRYLFNSFTSRAANDRPAFFTESEMDLSRSNYQESNQFEVRFVFSGQYQLTFYTMDMDTLEYTRQRITLTVQDSAYPPLTEVADALVQKCLKAGCTSDYEKALYFHDYIISHASYDHSLLYMGASGVLLRGTGTCESFHRAMELLLGRVGIPCYRAEGNGHVWSCVCLDGEWTQIDATWDAGASPQYPYLAHMYFGLTDELTLRAHDEHKPVASRPCTSYERNYFIRSGEISIWTEPLRETILQHMLSGETQFAIEAPYHMYPTVYTLIYPIVAYAINGTEVNCQPVQVSYDNAGKRYLVEVNPRINAALPLLRIPAGTETIGEEALRGAGLCQLEIPQSVSEVGAYAFADNPGLCVVLCPEQLTLPESALQGCPNAMVLTY